MESTARCFKQSTKQSINSVYAHGKRMANDDKFKTIEKYVWVVNKKKSLSVFCVYFCISNVNLECVDFQSNSSNYFVIEISFYSCFSFYIRIFVHIMWSRHSLEWKSLSQLSEDICLKDLRKLAINGGLKTSKFRSICWSLLLEVLTGRSQSWITQKRCDRDR